MNLRARSLPTFILGMAAATKQAIMAVQTDGSNASTSRYFNEIAGLPANALEELSENDIVFITGMGETDLMNAFDELVANFPEAGQTTLSITATLVRPNQPIRTFEQIHGYERELLTIDLPLAA